jgi:hypothetical protein
VNVPDSPANLAVFGKQTGHSGGSGYPLLRLLAVVCCGTRTIVDTVFGGYDTGETRNASGLLGSRRRRRRPAR